ncbi:glycosyltransferase family 2 protein [Paenibacillus sp. YYML68]|uniref:glycosyltransferase family 2 protein n=1 Tax=Paenibacillus sp. YYML68 TaxID=2909250 RepID=UPI00249391C5|nr:glycosyltransferase family 2 protein [Paenibacillus sp. YYML68]
MLYLDVIIVTFNSSKWIHKCMSSLVKLNYDLKYVYITVIDNNSDDNTCELLENFAESRMFGSYTILKQSVNHGFGKANNIGVKNTNNPFILFLNIDTELEYNSIRNLTKKVGDSNGDIALWELRQAPYEHPKYYDPITLETSWASSAACLIKRDIFIKVAGYDENLFLYGEDVDLSWRLRMLGYKLVYVPESVVFHYTSTSLDDTNKINHIMINNLYLRYKFGTILDTFVGYSLIIAYHVMKKKSNYLLLHKKIVASLRLGSKARKWCMNNKKSNKFKPKFIRFDYEYMKIGSNYKWKPLCNGPKVSIIIRTYRNPEYIKQALLSIRNQTYRSFEVIVVEDGDNQVEYMLKNEFSDLDIIYTTTGNNNIGRSKSANIGLALATGEYINFLDDDDLLYPDHLEILMSALQENIEYKVAYSLAYEAMIKYRSIERNYFRVLYRICTFNSKFSILTLIAQNFLPIQSVMFKREIIRELGGINEELDYLEDWHFWLKIACKYRFLYVEKITSEFRTSLHFFDRFKRRKNMKKSYDNMIVNLYHCNVSLNIGEYLEYKDKNKRPHLNFLMKMINFIRKGARIVKNGF